MLGRREHAAAATHEAAASGDAHRFAERVFRRRLVDEVLSSYLDWRESCALVRRAYRRWSEAGASDPGAAFLAYRATLDQEQRAGELYAEVRRRAERVLANGLEPRTGKD